MIILALQIVLPRVSSNVFWVSREWGEKSLILGHIRAGKTLELPRIIREKISDI